jgi:8-oxo-dGTP diphosphatase
MKYPRHVVGAVVIEGQCLLMVRNGVGPRKDLWGFPGGTVEWGETLEEALKRELREECNLEIEVQELFRLSDFIVRHNEDATDHFILSHHRSRVVGGELQAGSDAVDARWIPVHELEEIAREGGIIERLLEGVIEEIHRTQENR